MNTWLNTKLTEWNGFDAWQKTAYSIAIGLFFIITIYASYQYWGFNWSLISSPAMLLVFMAIYALLLTLFGSIGVWLCGYLGVLIATLFSGIRWGYRRICP